MIVHPLGGVTDVFEFLLALRLRDGFAALEHGFQLGGVRRSDALLRQWLSPHRGISKDKLTQYLRAFQLRRQLYRKPGREALKHALRNVL